MVSGELGVERKTLYVEMLVCTIFKISGEHGAAREEFPKKHVLLLWLLYFVEDILQQLCMFNKLSINGASLNTCLVLLRRAGLVAPSEVAARRHRHGINCVAGQIRERAHWRCVVAVDDIISLRRRRLIQLRPFYGRPHDLQGVRGQQVDLNVLRATWNLGGGAEEAEG